MSTNESVTGTGPAYDYLVVIGGSPIDRIRWDGVSDYAHPSGGQLVKADEWNGPAYMGPPEGDDTRTRRTRAERINALAQRISDDITAWDTLTANQRAAATLRGLRLLRALVRELRDDMGTDE